ncbi:MAG: hypothetical protein ACYDCG_05890 [Candidatus Acidiferrales bacterium]
MRFRSSVSKVLAALVVFIPVLAAMSGASPTPKAAPHARGAEGHCTPVGGTIMTNLGAIDQNTTMGTATGDLRGAVGAKILNSDGVNFLIEHHWVTEAGDTISFNPVTEVATPLNPTNLHIFGLTLPHPIEVTGGTGRFDGATGSIAAFGALDFGHGQTVFRYSGQVCFADPD